MTCRPVLPTVLACGPQQHARDRWRCECGPDSTGEAPDERPWCPQHGVVGHLTDLLGSPYCSAHDEPPRNCWEQHLGGAG